MNVAVPEHIRHQDALAQKMQQQFRACNAARDFFWGKPVDLAEGLYTGHGMGLVHRFYEQHDGRNGQLGYYPHYGEIEFLGRQKTEIASILEDTRTLRLVGAGPSPVSLSRKEMAFIPSLWRLEHIDVIDISPEIVADNVNYLRKTLPGEGVYVNVHGIVSDFHDAAAKLPQMPNTTVISLGGTIGNVPMGNENKFPRDAVGKSMQALHNLAGEDGRVVVSYDATQDPRIALEAYRSEYFVDYIMNAVEWAASCPRLHGMRPDDVRRVLAYQPIWQAEASTLRHNVAVREPRDLRYINDNHQVETISLPLNAQLNVLNSVKPEVPVMRGIGRANRLRTDMVMMMGEHDLALHFFSGDKKRSPAP